MMEKEEKAIECNLKALQISTGQYGSISFTTIEC